MQLKTSLSRHLIPVSNMAGTCSRWPFVSNDSCLSYRYCNLYSLHLMRAKTKETFTALVIIGYLSVYDRIVVPGGASERNATRSKIVRMGQTPLVDISGLCMGLCITVEITTEVDISFQAWFPSRLLRHSGHGDVRP